MGGKQESVATLILEQRRGLESVPGLKKQLRENQQELAELRLEGFRLSQTIERRTPVGVAVEEALPDEPTPPGDATTEERSALEKALRERLTETYERLHSIEDQLETANETYIKDYSAYVAEQSSYLDAVIEFQAFLNQTQIWIPNVPKFGLASVATLGASLSNLGSPSFWTNLVWWFVSVFTASLWMPWTGFALAGVLYAGRLNACAAVALYAGVAPWC